jgi:hypothetical protein
MSQTGFFFGLPSGGNSAKNKYCSEVFSHFIFPEPQFSCLLFFQNFKRLLTWSQQKMFLFWQLI